MPEGERSETTEMPTGAQVMISTPNFYRLEIAYSELPHDNADLTPLLDVRNGFYHVPNTLGLGHHPKPPLHSSRPQQIPHQLTLHRRSRESRNPRVDGRNARGCPPKRVPSTHHQPKSQTITPSSPPSFQRKPNRLSLKCDDIKLFNVMLLRCCLENLDRCWMAGEDQYLVGF